MKVQLSDKNKVKSLAAVFKHVHSLSDIVNLQFTDTGLYMQAMDNSHACLFELSLEAEWFDAYDLPTACVVGVYSIILSKVISCLLEGQTITLSMDADGDRLGIELAGEGTVTKVWALPLVDLESEHLEVPESDYSADISCRAQMFATLVSEMAIFSDSLRFNISEEQIALVASGDQGEMRAEIKEEDINEFCLEEDTTLSLTLGISYVASVCAFSKLAEDIYIQCSAETPVKFQFSLDALPPGESSCYMRFFVAPKIDD
jgi:proliferating cell nuclear antigen